MKFFVWILIILATLSHADSLLIFSGPSAVRTSAPLIRNRIGSATWRDTFAVYAKEESTGSYIPDGLTPAEYAAIKKKESEKVKSLKFGAFGPRFSPSSRPEGDWLLNRSLWTGGFDSSNARGLLNAFNPDITQIRVGKRAYLQRQLPYAAILWIGLEVFSLICAIIQTTTTAASPTPVAPSLPAHLRKFSLISLLVQHWTKYFTNKIIFIGKFLVSSLCSPLLERYLEPIRRKLLWSPRRFTFTIIGAYFGTALTATATLITVGAAIRK
uniref:Uncharacterized protein n=1 Tax=Corethron hystrix TaxID=216773 RepID=A0A7S1BQQ4_9STRA|mmetsp:Transcript_37513/g.87482  ORF Transcript_37513/g.87482 Transcript_37513/m.87482 type:complete len:270 (+) Transcript_37513:117-926(+)